jgi:hypothetical protein
MLPESSTSELLVRSGHWFSPVGLFLLQAAPVGLVNDPGGGVHFAFGGELGSYKEQDINCSGDVLRSQGATYHSVGGEADVPVGTDL